MVYHATRSLVGRRRARRLVAEHGLAAEGAGRRLAARDALLSVHSSQLQCVAYGCAWPGRAIHRKKSSHYQK